MRSNVLAVVFGAAVLAAPIVLAQAGGSAECPPQGDATRPEMQKLNQARARLDEVSDGDVDDTVTMESLSEPGDDSLRWQDGQGAEITAYVIDVRDGGPSSSNCHSPRNADHDTILVLAPTPNTLDRAHHLYAVVTPQIRREAAADRVDWSTGALRAQYLQQWVIVRGWLLFNPDAAPTSLHTGTLGGPTLTRMTAWELRPVTSLEVQNDVLDQKADLLPLPAGPDHQRQTTDSRERRPDRPAVSGGGEGLRYARSNASSSAP